MDNSGKEKEAMALMAEAEKKMKSSQSFFGSLFGWVWWQLALAAVWLILSSWRPTKRKVKQLAEQLAPDLKLRRQEQIVNNCA